MDCSNNNFSTSCTQILPSLCENKRNFGKVFVKIWTNFFLFYGLFYQNKRIRSADLIFIDLMLRSMLVCFLRIFYNEGLRLLHPTNVSWYESLPHHTPLVNVECFGTVTDGGVNDSVTRCQHREVIVSEWMNISASSFCGLLPLWDSFILPAKNVGLKKLWDCIMVFVYVWTPVLAGMDIPLSSSLWGLVYLKKRTKLLFPVADLQPCHYIGEHSQ